MACLLPHTVNWVQVNGGAGFICGALMWRLLRNTGATVFNLDKLCYASDLTNCSNNYGPLQFPEKLIPVVILKAVAGELFPLYGDGQNVCDLAVSGGPRGGGAGDLCSPGWLASRWRSPQAPERPGGRSPRP